MNIVELMMVEHVALRLHLRSIREKNSDLIYEVEDYVRNCHAKIEDEIIFPRLKEVLANNEQLVKVLSRLEADHKMIEKIGEQIRIRTAEGDLETTRKRIMLYADVLESHNSSEETLVFPFWSEYQPKGESEIAKRAKQVIEGYGRDRYFRVTGISEKLLNLAS